MRVQRPSAAAGLLGVEPAEEDAAVAGGSRQCEDPRRGQLVVERLDGNLVAIISGPRRAHDAAADLAFLLARELGEAVAKVLLHRRDLLRLDMVVDAFPAGVAVE